MLSKRQQRKAYLRKLQSGYRSSPISPNALQGRANPLSGAAGLVGTYSRVLAETVAMRTAPILPARAWIVPETELLCQNGSKMSSHRVTLAEIPCFGVIKKHKKNGTLKLYLRLYKEKYLTIERQPTPEAKPTFFDIRGVSLAMLNKAIQRANDFYQEAMSGARDLKEEHLAQALDLLYRELSRRSELAQGKVADGQDPK